MKKIIIQAIVSVCLFFAVLFGFSRVDWMSVFGADHSSMEKKLGEMYWEMCMETEEAIESDSVDAALDSLLVRLCNANRIDRGKIKLHVLRNDEINAFAFPDNHLILYSGLIGECENESELSGVMAHELAHMQKGHVMRKLIKEIGLTALIGLSSGGNGADLLKNTAKTLTSTAFDRDLESEADTVAVSYLIRAEISPRPMAEFLLRLSEEEGSLSGLAVWVSTHPGSKQRSQQITDMAARHEVIPRPVLSGEYWGVLKRSVRPQGRN